MGEVASARDETLPARLRGFRHRVRVGEDVVGGRERFGDERHREVGADPALLVELKLVDHAVRSFALHEI
jgi:hypothetical protein